MEASRLQPHAFVVPAYGRSPHLEQCLRSLADQTRHSSIVVATSSPFEGMRALVEAHGGTLHVHDRGGSIGRDWNAALAAANAQWVTLAHQDDVYLPTFVQSTLEAVRRHPNASLVFTGYREMSGNGRRPVSLMLRIKRVLLELGFLGRGAIYGKAAKRRALAFGCPVPCPSVTLPGATPFRFREDLKVNLDWDAWMRIAQQEGAFVYVRQALMLHRLHEGSETESGIRDGVRAAEDRMMFGRVWPAPIASVLARLYSLSYSNGT
ncbi:glycosyltransferase family 2 protein [Lysobacter soli]|nr:glycosyltransferase family 2 protein [Lysobacter soli]UTA54099.1 glycosyltransferase family 2 protein [Lysobacter soli]